MQQLWTNPSLERSFNQAVMFKSDIIECLKLSFKENNKSKELIIFPDMEYEFTFYDANTGCLRSLTALVMKITDNS